MPCDTSKRNRYYYKWTGLKLEHFLISKRLLWRHRHPRTATGAVPLEKRWEAVYQGIVLGKAEVIYYRICHQLQLAVAYDIHLARDIMMQLTIAEREALSPEVVSDNRHYFHTFWNHWLDKLCDVVRIRGLPQAFITISPAEWSFPVHSSMFNLFKDSDKLGDVQGYLTWHLYMVMTEFLARHGS